MTKKSSDGPVVGSVVNAVAILRHLSEVVEPCGVNAIARAANISPSSCFNILKTLTREEFILFEPEAKTYAIGPALLALAQSADAHAFPIARPLLRPIAERYACTAALWRVISRKRMLLLGFAESESAIRIHMTVGQRRSSLVGAGGRCVIPTLNLSTEQMRELFSQQPWHAAPSFEEYLAEIESVRANGYSIDDGKYLAGLTSIASVVVDKEGHAQFLTTASMFNGQHPNEVLQTVGAELHKTSLRLGKMLCGVDIAPPALLKRPAVRRPSKAAAPVAIKEVARARRRQKSVSESDG